MTWSFDAERATRIELAFSAWEADVLPLNYARGWAQGSKMAASGRRELRGQGGAPHPIRQKRSITAFRFKAAVQG